MGSTAGQRNSARALKQKIRQIWSFNIAHAYPDSLRQCEKGHTPLGHKFRTSTNFCVLFLLTTETLGWSCLLMTCFWHYSSQRYVYIYIHIIPDNGVHFEENGKVPLEKNIPLTADRELSAFYVPCVGGSEKDISISN